MVLSFNSLKPFCEITTAGSPFLTTCLPARFVSVCLFICLSVGQSVICGMYISFSETCLAWRCIATTSSTRGWHLFDSFVDVCVRCREGGSESGYLLTATLGCSEGVECLVSGQLAPLRCIDQMPGTMTLQSRLV